MKRKILMALTVLGCLTVVNADNNTVDWEKEEAKEVMLEQKTKELRSLVVEIDMLTTHAIRVAEETLLSLNNNLEFFEKVETSESFRQCVVLEEYIGSIEKDRTIALDLYRAKKVTSKQYESYTTKADERKNRLQSKLDKKKCK